MTLPDNLTVPEKVEVILRMDRRLPEKTIRALCELIRVGYAAAKPDVVEAVKEAQR